MSDDLISRQEAIDAIEILLEQSEDDEHDKTWNNAIRGSINAVKHHVPSAQPTIDAVEVVRCKECKYWYPNGIGFCTIHDIRPSQLDMADWFCADGKRKE